jgi:transcriptional regulator with XRE-family HTH domain
VTLFRYENVTSHPGWGGHRQQVNLAITRHGKILAGGDIGKAVLGDTMIGNGDLLDGVLAAYLTAHHYGWTLTQVPEPDLSQACPIDGDLGCGQHGELATARAQVMEAQQQPVHRQQLLGPMIETDRGGRIWPVDHHFVVAAEQLGYDWRSTAVVRVDGRTVPYRAWFADEEPDPGLPPRRLPPEPAPDVRTPGHVARWVQERIETGVLHVPGRLPDPDARRRIRESSGLSQLQLAELVGVSKSAIGNYENGRQPEDEAITRRYGAVLHDLRMAALDGDQPPGDAPPASAKISEAPKPAQAVELSDDARAQMVNDTTAAVLAKFPGANTDQVSAAVLAAIDKMLDHSTAAQPKDLFDADQLAQMNGGVKLTRVPHPDQGGRLRA